MAGHHNTQRLASINVDVLIYGCWCREGDSCVAATSCVSVQLQDVSVRPLQRADGDGLRASVLQRVRAVAHREIGSMPGVLVTPPGVQDEAGGVHVSAQN